MTAQPIPTTSHEAAAPVPSAERRGPARKRVLIPAIVVCGDGAEFRCILRDMSVTGAKIGITRRSRLPQRFKLVTGNCTDGYPMRLAWQRGDFAGLMLDNPEPVPAA